jgi:hypothetical protein
MQKIKNKTTFKIYRQKTLVRMSAGACRNKKIKLLTQYASRNTRPG